MSFVYRKNGQYLRYSERRTHTGTHYNVSWVSDINQASILGILPPLRIRQECEGADILRVKEHRQLQVVPLEADQPQACPLNAVDDVCKAFNGSGIYSVGAAAALRAMSGHWQGHLAEGNPPTIITDDINGLIAELRAMQASLFARLWSAADAEQPPSQVGPEATELTPTTAAEGPDNGSPFIADFGAADWFAQANDGGLECCVEAEKKMAWLKIHRKPQWARILCGRHGIKLSRSKDEGSLGRWNWLSDSNQGSEISFDTEAEAALNAVETLGLSAD